MTPKQPQIIALGGGGFSMEPDNLALDRYILEQTESARPKVCFIPTASGDSEGYQLRFFKAMATLPCKTSCLSLFRPPQGDLREFVLSHDVLYVGGGNTKNMLVLWKAWGLDTIISEAWRQGVVLAGISAGAICWFEQGLTDSIPGALTGLPCLGLLKGSCSPHYNGEANRRPSYEDLIRRQVMMPGVAIDDSCAVHYHGTTVHNVVRSVPNVGAYQVECVDEEIVEVAFDVEDLF